MTLRASKARALAEQIGNGATLGTFGAKPAGDIVILAVLSAGAVDVVSHLGDALAGKILADITNPFNADASGVLTTPGNSVAEQVAAVAPEGAHVVKSFNTIYGGVIAKDKPVDVFFAGDSAEAKASFAALLASMDMRPLDAGALQMAYALEWAGILLVGVSSNGAGFDIALGADSVWRFSSDSIAAGPVGRRLMGDLDPAPAGGSDGRRPRASARVRR